MSILITIDFELNFYSNWEYRMTFVWSRLILFIHYYLLCGPIHLVSFILFYFYFYVHYFCLYKLMDLVINIVKYEFNMLLLLDLCEPYFTNLNLWNNYVVLFSQLSAQITVICINSFFNTLQNTVNSPYSLIWVFVCFPFTSIFLKTASQHVLNYAGISAKAMERW